LQRAIEPFTHESEERFVLEEIERWRETLARDLALRNPHLSGKELNDAVQGMICSILFRRVAEDRGIELLPESLGRVYERFLGQSIRLTASRRVKIEEKPEARKAGGVYYTPVYIADYIVENTVGKLIEGQSPTQLAGLRALDMACGGGLFLIRAYQFLLDYHLHWYTQHHPERHLQAVRQHPPSPAVRVGRGVGGEGGEWRLTLAEKKRILTEHIFGVDIDRRAVEVTKISLLLKMLDGESRETLDRQSALPDLDANIKCGNSLIGPDDFDGQSLHDSGERSGGSFECVIGNPPYGAALTDIDRAYLSRKFKAGTTDTAALMMLAATHLVKPGGRVGFIVPKSFTYSSTWRKTREALLDELQELVDVGKVWHAVKLEQVIYFWQKGQPTAEYRSSKRVGTKFAPLAHIRKSECAAFGFYLNGIDDSELAIGRKIGAVAARLGDFTTNTRGAMVQRLVRARGGGRRVIGGKQVQRFALSGEKGVLASRTPLPPHAFVKPDSILVQNLVAHVINPVEHIRIIGTIAGCDADSIVILDTVNQLANRSALSSHYLLGLLLSRLINWYAYRFIFAKAIRTMHFDGPVSDRIPIRPLDLSDPHEKAQHDEIVAQVRRALALHRRLSKAVSDRGQPGLQQQIDAVEERINQLVYQLYGLTDEEIAVVENQSA